MIVKCHAKCGNFKIIAQTTSVGEVIRKTGYFVTFSIGDIVYYCDECYAKARDYAYGLLMIVKDKHVKLGDFFPPEQQKPHYIETTGRPAAITPRATAITFSP